MDRPQQKPAFYGWVNAALLFTIYFLTLGLVFYGFPVIFPAMIKATGWGRGEAAVAQSIMALLMGFLAPAAAWMMNRRGGRSTIGFGLLVLTVGLGLLCTVVTELWHWIVIWGIMMSVGFAFSGMVPIQTIINFWFNVRRSTAMGLVMTGAAAGGFIAQPFFTWLIEKTQSWRAGWMVAGLFVCLGLVMSFWLKNKPEDLGQHPDGLTSDEAEAVRTGRGRSSIYRTSEIWSLGEAMRTRALWLIMFVFLNQVMPVFMIVTHGVLHFLDLGYSRMQAASVLSFVLMGTGLARFPMGWLGDRVEPRRIIIGVMIIRLAAYTGLWQAPGLGLLIACGLLFGFTYGTTVVMIPALLANYFGPASFASISGFMWPFIIVFGATVPVGAGYIADLFGGYDLAFMALIGVITAGTVCAFLLSPPTKPR